MSALIALVALAVLLTAVMKVLPHINETGTLKKRK